MHARVGLVYSLRSIPLPGRFLMLSIFSSRSLFIPFEDLIVIGIAWTMAMINRRIPAIHARYMIATSIAFIEPALVRFIGHNFPNAAAYIWTVIIMDSIFLNILGLRI